MKIYTKTGDDGTTGLVGGDRVKKNDLRVKAYGTVDELNSFLGLAGAEALDKRFAGWIQKIQGHLFVLGAELACPSGESHRLKLDLLDAHSTEFLESCIDEMEHELASLRSFILPGGTRASALLHVARAVCRRSERAMVDLGAVRQDLLIYLNRLSDFLFVMARAANAFQGVKDIPWNQQ